jgi:hypothetical protein
MHQWRRRKNRQRRDPSPLWDPAPRSPTWHRLHRCLPMESFAGTTVTGKTDAMPIPIPDWDEISLSLIHTCIPRSGIDPSGYVRPKRQLQKGVGGLGVGEKSSALTWRTKEISWGRGGGGKFFAVMAAPAAVRWLLAAWLYWFSMMACRSGGHCTPCTVSRCTMCSACPRAAGWGFRGSRLACLARKERAHMSALISTSVRRWIEGRCGFCPHIGRWTGCWRIKDPKIKIIWLYIYMKCLRSGCNLKKIIHIIYFMSV